MDWLSHGFIPMALVWLIGRPVRERVAAAVGGLAPDLDAFIAWVAQLDPSFYALTHRGATHSLIGAPLIGLAALFVLSRRRLAKRWPKMGVFKWTRATALVTVIGGLSHLVLDGITITGVPLLWPLTTDRVSLGAFFFMLPLMAIVSLVAWVKVLRGRLTRRGVHTTLAILVFILALSGLVRAASLPEGGDGAVRTPGPLEWQWTVSRQAGGSVEVATYAFGQVVTHGSYPHVNATEAAGAIDACRDLRAYTGWRWDGWGLEVFNATRDGDAWNVTIHDSVRLHALRSGETVLRPPWVREDDEPFRCRVGPDGAADVLDP